MKKIRVGIIGVSSLTGGMLLKLLSSHKYTEISLLISDTAPDKKIEDIHKFLKGISFVKTSRYDRDEIIKKCDVVFLAKPHGQFIEEFSELIRKGKEKNIKFIDLSANLRLKDVTLYKEWYNIDHDKEETVKEAVYGLPEIYAGDIKNAFLIANPGCYPTCTILGLAPLFFNKYVDTKQVVIVDAHCGVSGAGRRPNERNMAIEVEENIKPYNVAIHPHTPEMEQELGNLTKDKVNVLFVPHVSSFKNGMLITMYLKLNKDIELSEIRNKYNEFYKNKPFVRIYENENYPEIQNVQGTNFCDIKVIFDKRTNTCICISAIDNLIKGASGQAIQNMNIMFGFDQTEGLPYSDVLKKG